MTDPFDYPPRKAVEVQVDRVYVLCEGDDEVAVVQRLALQLGLSLVAARSTKYGDMARELRQFGLAAVRERPRGLGVLRDKETSGEAAEDQVRGWLQSAGFLLAARAGEVRDDALADTGMRVGYFLNPEREAGGAIERLFVDQITEPLKTCVEDFVATVESTGLWEKKQSLEVLKDKVRLRAYLAARQGGTNTSLNAGLTRGYVNVATPAFDGLRDFLRRLCA